MPFYRPSLAPALVAACLACRPTSPPSEVLWDTDSAWDETKSTHLWIVQRALDILALHKDLPAARDALARMREPSCQERWQQGLLDADYKAAYNGGRVDLEIGAKTATIGLSGATWASHFFDAETSLNYKGDAENTALTRALAHAQSANPDGYDWQTSPGTDAEKSACYELGLSIHFFTDITQPMHANNFTSLSRPKGLHSNAESYAMSIQDRYPATDWQQAPSGGARDFVIAAAQRSKAEWPAFRDAVTNAYRAASRRHPIECGKIDVSAWNVFSAQELDHPLCWSGDAAVDNELGSELIVAQDLTSQYLALLAGGWTSNGDGQGSASP
jgi:phospholipase C